MLPPGQNGRDDCLRKGSSIGIAANFRTTRRQRPSRVTSVGQDPNLAAPVAHLSYLNFSNRMTILHELPASQTNEEGAQCDTNLKALPRSKWRSVGCRMRCMLGPTEASACR